MKEEMVEMVIDGLVHLEQEIGVEQEYMVQVVMEEMVKNTILMVNLVKMEPVHWEYKLPLKV
jgi:hypothetical protein